MKLAIVGTGTVGRTLAVGWASCGHDVVVGTRNPLLTAERPLDDSTSVTVGSVLDDAGIALVALADVAAGADVVVNATNGAASVAALGEVGATALAGKVLLDVANPLDFSNGFPPTLSVCNDDSLAEQIQRQFPAARVVKSLNTVNASVMVEPAQLAAPSAIFLAGDDADAKAIVAGLLADLGWEQVVDLGDLGAARGMEMYLPLWLRLMGALGTAQFNIAVVRAAGGGDGYGDGDGGAA